MYNRGWVRRVLKRNEAIYTSNREVRSSKLAAWYSSPSLWAGHIHRGNLPLFDLWPTYLPCLPAFQVEQRHAPVYLPVSQSPREVTGREDTAQGEGNPGSWFFVLLKYECGAVPQHRGKQRARDPEPWVCVGWNVVAAADRVPTECMTT